MNFKKLFWLLGIMVLLTNNTTAAKKKYDSYNGLIMAGYQGWFNTPEDGAQRGWRHLGKNKEFKPGFCNIDLWPDVSEYKITYKTGFNLPNGDVAPVFSSYDESTVNTHFKWMKDYEIDGVFMQRFVSEIKNPRGLVHFNKVLASAFSSSMQYGRAIAIMYDLSGMKSGDENVVLKDLDELDARYKLHNRNKATSYLYHNGKPLVSIWGVGFNDHRAYGMNEVNTLIAGLKKRGFSIMIGVPAYWREFGRDTEKDTELHNAIKQCDIVMPWFVGRYNEKSYTNFSASIDKDLQWCKTNNIDYAPLAFPGFSWRNMKGLDTKQAQRNNGQFYWSQLSTLIKLGCKMIYVAMFDEMDEGTAIFKCATEVPVGESPFVQLDEESGSDYYLWLTGEAGQMLKGKLPVSDQLPNRK